MSNKDKLRQWKEEMTLGEWIAWLVLFIVFIWICTTK
jgi:hypothetical protein